MLFFALSLYAELPNSDLVKIHAKLFPQIILFNDNIKNSDEIIIASLYSNRASKEVAEAFKQSVQEQYGATLKGKKLTVVTMYCDEALRVNYQLSAIYITDCENSYLKPLVSKIISLGSTRIIFDNNNALFYIEITSKTTILLNKKTIQSANFGFSPSLLKMVKIIDND